MRSFIVCAVAVAVFAGAIIGMHAFLFAVGVWIGSGSGAAWVADVLAATWPLIVTLGGAAIIIGGMYEK